MDPETMLSLPMLLCEFHHMLPKKLGMGGMSFELGNWVSISIEA